MFDQKFFLYCVMLIFVHRYNMSRLQCDLKKIIIVRLNIVTIIKVMSPKNLEKKVYKGN